MENICLEHTTTSHFQISLTRKKNDTTILFLMISILEKNVHESPCTIFSINAAILYTKKFLISEPPSYHFYSPDFSRWDPFPRPGR